MTTKMSTKRYTSEFYPKSEVEAIMLLRELGAQLKTVPGGYKPLPRNHRQKTAEA